MDIRDLPYVHKGGAKWHIADNEWSERSMCNIHYLYMHEPADPEYVGYENLCKNCVKSYFKQYDYRLCI